MNTRRINQILWTCAALLGAGAVIVFVLGFVLPLDSRASEPPGTSTAPAGASGAALPSVASLEPLWDLRLRGDLLPAPESPQPATARLASDVAPASGNVPVSLVGTIGESLAILRHESGQVDVRAAGESVAGVEVLEVRPARVRVRYNGQVMTLQKPLDAQGGL